MAALSIAIFAFSMMMLTTALASPKDKPLNEEEIIELLQAHVASAHATEIVDERGINFNFTAEIEQKVRDAGGGDDVVAALKRASQRYAESQAPRTGELVVKTTPGEAQVYLNDEPKGITSPEGEIRLPDMQPANYNLRVSLLGYQSFERSITIEAGEPQTVYVTLVQKSDVSPSRPNQNLPQVPPATELPAGGIPIPGVKVTGVRFYEGPFSSSPEKSARVYRDTFFRTLTRTIYWELDLTFPAAEQRIDFKVDAMWYRPDGSKLTQQSISAYVLPTWKGSYHNTGYGWTDTNHWPEGTYRVDLYYQNTQIASGTFQIK
ncbi:MAG: PEGA domain-containing protein [Terriglobia bacterium]